MADDLVYAEIVSIPPHTYHMPFPGIHNVTKPSVARPEAAPIPVARAEIANVAVGKDRVGADTSKQGAV